MNQLRSLHRWAGGNASPEVARYQGLRSTAEF